MGSLLTTDEKNYDTARCFAGCREKCYVEDRDPLHCFAFQESDLLKNGILFLSIGHRFGTPDVVRIILSLWLEAQIKERIDSATKLTYPWIKKYDEGRDLYVFEPPACCDYAGKNTRIMTIVNTGLVYRIPNYFWFDDIYISEHCQCPLRKARLERELDLHRAKLESQALRF